MAKTRWTRTLGAKAVGQAGADGQAVGQAGADGQAVGQAGADGQAVGQAGADGQAVGQAGIKRSHEGHAPKSRLKARAAFKDFKPLQTSVIAPSLWTGMLGEDRRDYVQRLSPTAVVKQRIPVHTLAYGEYETRWTECMESWCRETTMFTYLVKDEPKPRRVWLCWNMDAVIDESGGEPGGDQGGGESAPQSKSAYFPAQVVSYRHKSTEFQQFGKLASLKSSHKELCNTLQNAVEHVLVLLDCGRFVLLTVGSFRQRARFEMPFDLDPVTVFNKHGLEPGGVYFKLPDEFNSLVAFPEDLCVGWAGPHLSTAMKDGALSVDQVPYGKPDAPLGEGLYIHTGAYVYDFVSAQNGSLGALGVASIPLAVKRDAGSGKYKQESTNPFLWSGSGRSGRSSGDSSNLSPAPATFFENNTEWPAPARYVLKARMVAVDEVTLDPLTASADVKRVDVDVGALLPMQSKQEK